jgi:hypothetical protein
MPHLSRLRFALARVRLPRNAAGAYVRGFLAEDE